jgi:hypothetical protein
MELLFSVIRNMLQAISSILSAALFSPTAAVIDPSISAVPPKNGRNVLASLPSGVRSNLSSFLDVRSLLNLSSASTEWRESSLWDEKLFEACQKRGFGDNAKVLLDECCAAATSTHTGAVCTAFVNFLNVSKDIRGIPASRWEITWSWDARYFNKASRDPSSVYGSVVELKSVCWLEMSGHLFVPPGDHDVFMRVNSRGDWGHVTRGVSIESVVGEGTASFTVPPERLNTGLLPKNVWGWIYIGSVSVLASAAKVRWFLNDTSGSWKTGVKLDVIRLVPSSRAAALGFEELVDIPFFEDSNFVADAL